MMQELSTLDDNGGDGDGDRDGDDDGALGRV